MKCGNIFVSNLYKTYIRKLLKIAEVSIIIEKRVYISENVTFIDTWESGGMETMRAVLGICAFAFFFASDYNDWKWGRQELKLCFPAGGLLLVAVTVLGAVQGKAPLTGGARWAVLALAVLFLALLVYTLFFALPALASYARPGKDRTVIATGVYALCRHPGVLWFAGLYLCLWGAAGLPLWEAVLYSGLNVLLVVFEDRCVFPDRLEGYGAYQHTTPFLVPSRRSIRACRETLRGEEKHAV